MAIEKEKFQDIIDYYDHTRFDYRVAWDNSPTPAVHFGFYDDTVSKHTDALMNTNKVLADWAKIKAGDKVLDAGCGKGGSSFWLALNRKAEAVGITPVQSQIDDCNLQRKELELEDQTSFVLADYCNTPFADESFDVVWALESLCHAKDKSLFYKEAYRVLKPGGRLIIAEYYRTKRPHNYEEEKLLASWLNRWAIEDIDTEGEHLQHATKAGFQNIQITDVTKNTQVSLRNLHNNSKNWLWFSKLLQLVRVRSRIQHDNQYASIQQYKALQQKLWFYAFLFAEKK